MEFEIITDLSVLPAVIESNAEEVKAQLSQALEHYRTLAVTPETIQQAKADKASLNKLRAAIEDRRKEIKRQCLAPYEAFEAKCREITALIDEPIGMIDSQLKELSDAAAEEKLHALQDYFSKIKVGLHETDVSWIDLHRILNPKWKNASMKLDALKQEVWETVFRMSEEMQELQRLYGHSPLFPAIRQKYLDNYSMTETLVYASGVIPSAPPLDDGKRISGTFRMTGTKAQIFAVRDYMKQIGVEFEVIT